jgi:nitrile hydratase accessory protein
LSQLEPRPLAEQVRALPRLPLDEDGPIFTEPWQAQAFALAVKLCEQRHFTWTEWGSAFADELKAAADRGEPDDGSRYYHHWLAALEHMVTTKGLSDPAMLQACKEDWAHAHRRTPHGQPIELTGDSGSSRATCSLRAKPSRSSTATPI